MSVFEPLERWTDDEHADSLGCYRVPQRSQGTVGTDANCDAGGGALLTYIPTWSLEI